MKIRITIILLISLLFISLFFNIKTSTSNTWFVSFPEANTRHSYDTFHHIKKAQELATGKGIKVGIIGKYFGYSNNTNLYAGGKNFTGDKEAFETVAEHGLWMATTLKEISPDVEIYALNARDKNRENEAKAIIEAIQWAVDTNIDILTYSAEAFDIEYKEKIDKAVQKANDKGVVTTFIHYSGQENILPNGFFPNSSEFPVREADVNIFHFDYNVLMLFKYENYLKLGRDVGNNLGAHPYFSNSSMSPVLAGIVAMMKEVNNNLKPVEYKKILIETSKKINYQGYEVNHVVDAPAAIKYLKQL